PSPSLPWGGPPGGRLLLAPARPPPVGIGALIFGRGRAAAAGPATAAAQIVQRALGALLRLANRLPLAQVGEGARGPLAGLAVAQVVQGARGPLAGVAVAQVVQGARGPLAGVAVAQIVKRGSGPLGRLVAQLAPPGGRAAPPLAGSRSQLLTPLP